MHAVSDTSPILNLAWIGRLDLLREQFSILQIPQAVADELRRLATAGALEAIEAAITDEWIVIVPVKSAALVRKLRGELDTGESEAIGLAVESASPRILIDEHDGRRVAQNLGLRATGVVGVLMRAKLSGRIANLAGDFDRLKLEANFYLDDALVRQALASVGE